MRLPPVPRGLARRVAAGVVLAWILQMALVVRAAYLQPQASLTADLARYGAGAQWKGIYYKGEKIGWSVAETRPVEDGFELLEDGRLQMTLLGSSSAARLHTEARVDRAFALRTFRFSIDPGTGPLAIEGRVEGLSLELEINSPSGNRRTETRRLSEPPNLSLNLARRLVARGLKPGLELSLPIFDPATLQNAPMQIRVESRDVVWSADRPVPTYRVRQEFAGVRSTTWVTDVGEVVKEESPMGFMMLRETRARATALAVPGDVQLDLLEAAAVVPKPARRIDDPLDVVRLRVRLTGHEFAGPDVEGGGQTVDGDVFEIQDALSAPVARSEPDLERYRNPEPFLESDAPEIIAETRTAVGDRLDPKDRAERLVRHVHALLRKKPTISLPSALEVLRTRVGDCNEHTALYVAMARAAGIPARIAVGLVSMRSAFYYHAWAEVFLETGAGSGRWVPADPTLDQFPADLTHIRLARGGLDRQAVLTQVIGQLQMKILDLELRPGATPVLMGRTPIDTRPLEIPIPKRDGSGQGCWSKAPD